MSKATTDYRMAALVLEVERRRKIPGFHNYSYGRLVADTTPEQRQEIVDRYKHSHRRHAAGTYKEPDDKADLCEAAERALQEI